jgi:hypothetical protein
MAPVWFALEEHERGTCYTAKWHYDHAEQLGIEAKHLSGVRKNPSPFCVVCSETDRNRAGNRVIRFEHGAGFSFNGGGVSRHGGHPSYAGGRRQFNVVSFLSVNRWADARWREAYPDAHCAIVGSPKLDAWYPPPVKQRDVPPTVCISFHWDARVAPETRWALPHYKHAVRDLTERDDMQLIGHGHPKAGTLVKDYFIDAGIEWVEHFDEVVARTDLYCNDSSSTLYEFAALDRPVVVLNAPWFRREIHHGLRFWENSDVGIIVNEPDELLPGILAALKDPLAQKARRAQIMDEVFPYRGQSAQRAAEEIRKAPFTLPPRRRSPAARRRTAQIR